MEVVRGESRDEEISRAYWTLTNRFSCVCNTIIQQKKGKEIKIFRTIVCFGWL